MPKAAAILAIFLLIVQILTGCVTQASAQDSASSPPGSTPAPSGIIRFFDICNVDVRDVPMRMALDDLRAQGYTVETTLLCKSSLIADGLARGKAEIGLFNNQTSWKAIHKGANLRTIVQPVGSTAAFAAKKEIATCTQLDGKAVGLAGIAGLSPALLDLYFQKNCPGIEPRLLVIPESAGRAAALLAGEIEAALMPGEELLKLQQIAPDSFHALYFVSQEYPQIRKDALHVRRDWAQENPQAVKDLLRALLKANRRIAENPQLLYQQAQKRLELDPAVVKQVADAHLHNSIWDANGGLTTQNVQNTIDFLVALKKLPQGLTVDDVADLSYLNSVLDEIGRR